MCECVCLRLLVCACIGRVCAYMGACVGVSVWVHMFVCVGAYEGACVDSLVVVCVWLPVCICA